MLRKLKYVPIVLVVLAFVVSGLFVFKTLMDRQIPYDIDLAGTLVPSFEREHRPLRNNLPPKLQARR